MTFVTAGICGDLSRYEALLKKIKLKDEDVLYVIGDVSDFGEQGMDVLLDMSMRANVYPVAGKNDFLALRMLTGFDRMLKDGSSPTPEFAAEMMAWAQNGGKTTLDGFRALDAEMREGVLDYLSEFTLFEEVEVGNRSYVLAYAGVGNFDADKTLDEYEPDDFFEPVKGDIRLFEDKTLVVGCVPTASGRVERADGLIRMDCGVKNGGKLACICLETDEEIYV